MKRGNEVINFGVDSIHDYKPSILILLMGIKLIYRRGELINLPWDK